MKQYLLLKRGSKHSEETIKRLREIATGRVLSEEHKQHIGDALRGRPGKPLSESTKRKIGDANRGGHVNVGSNHGAWKGDDVGYWALHDWMIKQIPKPDYCERCKIRPPDELANISPSYNRETYNRDIKNWWWACHSCHIFYDQRKRRSTEEKMKNSTCSCCGILYIDVPRTGSHNTRHVMLNRGTGLFLCNTCVWYVYRKEGLKK